MMSTARLYLALALLRLAAAAAVSIETEPPMDNSTLQTNTLQARAWSPKDSAAEFEVYAQYSAAAYCSELYDGFDRTPVCSNRHERGCPNFAATTTVAEFLNDRVYAVGGYVAVNPTRRQIVVAFKGTSGGFDVATDVNKGLTASHLCQGCFVHAGFYNAFNRLAPQLERTVRAQLAHRDRRGYRVVITGHSLGGALATLAAVHLRNLAVPCDVYTYGAPRVGNDRFAAHVAAQPGFTARITNARDLVTAIPRWGWLMWARSSAYAHHYPEYWYPDGLDRGTVLYDLPRRVCAYEGQCSSAVCHHPFNLMRWQGCRLDDHLKYINGDFRPCGAPSPAARGRFRVGRAGFGPDIRLPEFRLPDPQAIVRWLQ